MKTPEEYLEESVRPPEADKGQGGLTAAEQAFVEKYLGMAGAPDVSSLKRYDPRGSDSVAGFAAPAAASDARAQTADVEGPGLDEQLKRETELQLVSFRVDEQEFAVPIITIQEVIRAVPPTRLPAAPSFVEGVINLRGRVTPLISLRALLGMGGDVSNDRFIIVCGHRGLQMGMIVTSVVTMYRATQPEIEWGIEARVGIRADHLAGILKRDERLINIISVDRLVARVLAK